jgi:hypothetical protein
VAFKLDGWLFVLEDFLDCYSEAAGDSESQFDRGHVFPLFQGDNRLAGAAGKLGKLLLRHFVIIEPESSDAVYYLSH